MLQRTATSRLAPTAPINIHAMLRHDIVMAHLSSPVRVNEDRVRAALDLLDVLPNGVPTPTMAIAIDGELAFLWEQDDKRLAVIPDKDGWLRFGAELRRNTPGVCGVRHEACEHFAYPFLPNALRELLKAFRRADA